MTSPTPDTTQPAAPRRRRHLPWIASAALTFVVALALVLLLLRMGSGQSGARGSRHASLTVSWQTYRDPAGLFTVRIPAGWTATRDSGVGVVGDRTGHASQTNYFIALGDPPHGMKTITVYVIESPIDSVFLHNWECAAWYPRPFVNATVDGLPAQTDGQGGLLFDTRAAHYQVDWTMPGFQGDTLMTTSPTPIPQVDFQADQQLGARILASFTPTPATPLVC